MTSKNNPPRLFLIAGPSGSGQDSIINGLKKLMRFNRVITTVTRPMRPGERPGRPYHFVSRPQFMALLKQRAFIEWARVYGDLRGCTRGEIERLLKLNKPIIWKVDWQGVLSIKKKFARSVSIFIEPENYKVLERRLLKRGQDSLAEIKKRERFTRAWLKRQDAYDYVVINKEGCLPQTIKKVHAIIRSELAK